MLRDTTEFSDELKLLIRARFPLVHISTYEEDRAVAIVEAIGAELGKKVVLWSASRGVHGTNKASLDRKDLLDGAWGPFPAATAAALSELGAALALFDSVATHKKRYKAGYLFVLLDPYPYLSGHGVDAIQRRRLRDFVIAIRNGGHHANCLIVSQSLDIPAELEKEISIIDLPLPTRLEIERHISELIEKLRPNKAFKIAGGQELIGRMVDSTVGLTMAEIDNCLARAVVDDLRLPNSLLQRWRLIFLLTEEQGPGRTCVSSSN